LYRTANKISIQILLFIASLAISQSSQIRDEESCQVFLKEEAEDKKHYVPGNVPLIKEELLLER
jgi:hypothetical protein